MRQSLKSTAQAVASGLLYGVSFPPTALQPLAWVALVPLLLALERRRSREAFALGLVFTVVFAYVISDFLPSAVAHYSLRPLWVGAVVLGGAILFTAALPYAVFAACYAALSGRFARSLPLLGAAAWVGAELVRVQAPIGNPWGIAGYSQVASPRLAQIADATGVYGLSFLVVAVNATIAVAWRTFVRRGLPRCDGGVAVGLATIILLGVLGYGERRLHQAARPQSTREVEVAVVQGDLAPQNLWDPQQRGHNLGTYLRLSRAALADSAARLLVWPESAMSFFVEEEPEYQEMIGRMLSPRRAQLLAGGPGRAGDDSYFNSVFLLGSTGRILSRYDKRDLLALSEQPLLPGSDLSRRDFGPVRRFVPGIAHPALHAVAGRAGVLTCNEAMLPGSARDRVLEGAEILVNPANDAWLRDRSFALQAFDIVRLRAVEQRRDLIRASTSGPSAIIDAYGRVRARTAIGEEGWIAAPVRQRHERSPYSRVGDLFALTCVVVTTVAWGWSTWRGRRPMR
jgi:apolipoprotein N-acyltransferase